jgi:methylamine utilization protein MauE
MSIFVQSTSAPRPKTKDVRTISLALAAVLIVMAVTQLFTFENFPDVIQEMWLVPGSMASVVAAMIVILEVVALPFLLGMQLSLAARAVSMAAGWLVLAGWFILLVWQNVSGNVTTNSGLLGDTISLPVGWWSVFLLVALGILAAWASWGQWPFATKKAK